jgi:2-amino-4-hydroxy-6-hydroxymethyldihydropteridine diphosphokinase
LVLIGLGSNQGESREILLDAMTALEKFAMPGSFARSSLWRTSPVDCPPDSNDFINAAVSFAAIEGLTPERLLVELKQMEREYGRRENFVRNAPRELDLDLLLFNDETRASEEFTLPHPRAQNRLFVLAPANQVAAAAVWPEIGRTTAELLAELETNERVEALDT